MKNLEIIPGLQEMNAQEMKEIDGGGVWKSIIKLAEYIGLTDMALDMYDGFSEQGTSRQYSWK